MSVKILYVTSYHGSWRQVLHARRNVEGVENFPAQQTGSVHIDIASAHRGISVKTWMWGVYCMLGEREPCFQPDPTFLNVHFGLITMWMCLVLHTHTHAAGRHGIWGVCVCGVKSERTSWIEGRRQPLSALLNLQKLLWEPTWKRRRNKH